MCVLALIGCWPIIRGDYLEYACSTRTMLITLKVKGEQIMSDNPGIVSSYWGFDKAGVKRAEQQESVLEKSGLARWYHVAYLRRIREEVIFDPRA